MELRIETQGRVLSFDTGLEIKSAHKFIFNFAKNHNGVFDRGDYAVHLAKSDLKPEMQKKMIGWNQTTLTNLEKAGYVKCIGIGRYQLVAAAVDWAERPKPRPDFKLGKNHIKILSANTGGIVRSAHLKSEHDGKPQNEYNRQAKIIDGMIKNLIANSYLERAEKGCYRLTKTAVDALLNEKNAASTDKTENKQKIAKEPKPGQTTSVKITDFDRRILEVTDENGFIRADFVDAHERGESISKRIKSLEKCGLIADGKITAGLEERIKLAGALSRSRKLTLDLLTKEQRLLLTDMRLFLNLTSEQIIKHIYDGNFQLYNRDMELLKRHSIIKLMSTRDIYVLDKNGVNLSNMLLPDVGFYKSKVYSRPAEVGHDVLVYTAYKDIEKQILRDGGKIVTVKNDRMLRSEDAKLYGHMKGKGEYPDLQIIYKDKYGLEHIHNLEIDCGYDAKTIGEKLSAFFGSSGTGSFTWCCKGIGQAAKVAKIADGDKSKRLRKHKPLYISYIDGSGNVKKLKWS